MGNYLGRLIARAYEVIDWLNVRRSLPTPDQTAGSHMVASEECAPSEDEGALGGRGSAGSSSEQKPECMSVRAEAMMRSRSEFSSDADYEIEHSRVHWSELADLADGGENIDAGPLFSTLYPGLYPDASNEIEHSKGHSSEGGDDGDSDEDSDDKVAVSSEVSSVASNEIEISMAPLRVVEGVGHVVENSKRRPLALENFEVFLNLGADPQWEYPEIGSFFRHLLSNTELGQKIAEGGQAEIFEWLDAGGNVIDCFLLKVFKKGTRLAHLRQQWPSGFLEHKINRVVLGGLFTEDGRFAFAMIKCWGDLRKLINQAMQAKNNQGPPFPFKWNGVTLHAISIIGSIAVQLYELHKKGIVHRDLKASNILLNSEKTSYAHVLVADFEFSIGVTGTGFWRAPEILLGLKNKSAIELSEKTDVYGYAMTCFEIVTGLLPFEGELEQCQASYDLVIKGQRPKLPRDLDEAWKYLIENCWNPNPHERPSFARIVHLLTNCLVAVKRSETAM